MVRKKEVLKKNGRPSGSSKAFSDSRTSTLCVVGGCTYSGRNDNVQQHQRSLVLFKSDGSPATECDLGYKNLSDKEKLHTDWFHSNCYSSTCLPRNKRPGDKDSYTKRPS